MGDGTDGYEHIPMHFVLTNCGCHFACTVCIHVWEVGAGYVKVVSFLETKALEISAKASLHCDCSCFRGPYTDSYPSPHLAVPLIRPYSMYTYAPEETQETLNTEHVCISVHGLVLKRFTFISLHNIFSITLCVNLNKRSYRFYAPKTKE